MPTDTNAAPDPRLERLATWLSRDLGLAEHTLAPASADASFRRYFRVTTGGRTLIAMDAPPEREDVGPFVRVAAALAATGVTVPEVLAEDRQQGFLLLSDLGSTHYLAALAQGADPESLYADASQALLQIQLRGSSAAAKLDAYGPELLRRELTLFPEWFLHRHLGQEIDDPLRAALERIDDALVAAALEQPAVLVHRDYHSRNLMVLEAGNPGILDFQDAVRGAITYDLVSLYKDCYVSWPREQVLGWVERHRRAAGEGGLVVADAATFVRWFDLMGLQRHLKVLGIFARLWYRDGKRGYLGDLPRVLAYVVEASRAYPEMRTLTELLDARVLPYFAAAQARAGAP